MTFQVFVGKARCEGIVVFVGFPRHSPRLNGRLYVHRRPSTRKPSTVILGLQETASIISVAADKPQYAQSPILTNPTEGLMHDEEISRMLTVP